MFAIEMLPAGYGDCLLVTYGTARDKHRLLIDAGPAFYWESVRAELMRQDDIPFDLFVITHIDEDHIGGAISLLDDPNLKHLIDRIWFNGYVHCESGGNVLGPVQGEQLTSRIAEGGFTWNHGFDWPEGTEPEGEPGVGGPVVVPSTGDLPVVDLPGGARAVILSPTGPKLKRLAGVWAKVVAKAGLVGGAGDPRHTSSPPPRPRVRPQLPDPLDDDAVRLLAARNASDGSEANGSSIAFVLEYDGKRLLLGADAHAGVLRDGLDRYAATVGTERPHFDAVKLAHHGSNANLSTRMLARVECSDWLISTDGFNYCHPDDAALAKVITTATGPVTFHSNYEVLRDSWALAGAQVGATFEFPSSSHSMQVDL